ncbi:unnamed protein product [Linum trigynum]|uniref:Uncharacterized protein n=1 Tax=Linum trigynum TaxID=586398 RepID=A0AAV2DDT0_9ROSI
MTWRNPSPLVPLDETINRTLRLLAREWELVEARRKIEEREQPQFDPEVEVEEEVELEEEEGSEAEMVENQNAQERNEETRTMGYYMAPRAADIQPTIMHPPMAANNFEIKLSLVTVIQNNIQFHGLKDESPREHIQ